MVVESARSVLEQWQKAQASIIPVIRPQQWVGTTKWHKTQSGWLKCNVDAATSSENHNSSFGSILRNEQGSFVSAFGGSFRGEFDPKIAEAMAFREALSWVKETGIRQVAFELDSLLVVQAMRSKKRDLSYFGDVITDCRNIAKDLGSYSVHFVKRSANMVAHMIAREAISMSECKCGILSHLSFPM